MKKERCVCGGISSSAEQQLFLRHLPRLHYLGVDIEHISPYHISRRLSRRCLAMPMLADLDVGRHPRKSSTAAIRRRWRSRGVDQTTPWQYSGCVVLVPVFINSLDDSVYLV